MCVCIARCLPLGVYIIHNPICVSGLVSWGPSVYVSVCRRSVLCGCLSSCASPAGCVLGLGWCVPCLLSPWEQNRAQGRGDTPSLNSPFSWEPAWESECETKSRLRQELGPLLQPAQAPGGNCGSHRSDLPTVPGCQEARLPAGLCCQLPPWAWARSSVSRAQPAEGPH